MSLEAVPQAQAETQVHRPQRDFAECIQVPAQMEANGHDLDGSVHVHTAQAGKITLPIGKTALHHEPGADTGVHIENVGTDVGETYVRKQIDRRPRNPAPGSVVGPEGGASHLHAYGEPLFQSESHYAGNEAGAVDLVRLYLLGIETASENLLVMSTPEIFRRHARICRIRKGYLRLRPPVTTAPLGECHLDAKEQGKDQKESLHGCQLYN